MAPRYRATNSGLPPVQLPAEDSFALGQLVSELTLHGALTRYHRKDGREVVRLTVSGLFPMRALVWQEMFSVGTVSTPRRASEDARLGARWRWQVEGRWACLRVLDPFIPYIGVNLTLFLGAVDLFITQPEPPASTCLASGCAAAVYGRGLCRAHHRYASQHQLLTAKGFGRPGRCTLCGGALGQDVFGLCRACSRSLAASEASP